MKTARSQFIKSVGLAVDIAAEEGVPPIEMISSLGSYVSVFKEMGQMFGLAKRVYCSSFSYYAACR